jgi:hypothetical protein
MVIEWLMVRYCSASDGFDRLIPNAVISSRRY